MKRDELSRLGETFFVLHKFDVDEDCFFLPRLLEATDVIYYSYVETLR